MRVIMALTAHFDMELHQMSVKSVIYLFINGNMDEDIVMLQPPGFTKQGKESMVYNPNKSIY